MSYNHIIKPRQTKKDDPLKKRIPRNPRYRDVEAVVDSGSSMNRYLKRIEEIRTNYRYRPDELFKRMKVTTFVQLIVQVSSVDGDIFFDDQSEMGDTTRPSTQNSELQSLDNGMDTDRSDRTITGTDTPAQENGRDTTRSTLHGLITGVGEFETSHPPPAKPTSLSPSQPDPYLEDRPFLVLDVRDQDEFTQCHVISAENFPIALLSRSCNYESKSMLQYKNQPGKIIIIYDDEERMAPKAATTLVERGYDNLFLLSGGLKVAGKLFPTGLVTGTIPAEILPSNKGKPIEPASKQMFLREDVFALLDATETSVDKNSSSRMSRASKASSGYPESARSSASAASSASMVLHRKPFK